MSTMDVTNAKERQRTAQPDLELRYCSERRSLNASNKLHFKAYDSISVEKGHVVLPNLHEQGGKVDVTIDNKKRSVNNSTKSDGGCSTISILVKNLEKLLKKEVFSWKLILLRGALLGLAAIIAVLLCLLGHDIWQEYNRQSRSISQHIVKVTKYRQDLGCDHDSIAKLNIERCLDLEKDLLNAEKVQASVQRAAAHGLRITWEEYCPKNLTHFGSFCITIATFICAGILIFLFWRLL